LKLVAQNEEERGCGPTTRPQKARKGIRGCIRRGESVLGRKEATGGKKSRCCGEPVKGEKKKTTKGRGPARFDR